jgi:hypothetical protein
MSRLLYRIGRCSAVQKSRTEYVDGRHLAPVPEVIREPAFV